MKVTVIMPVLNEERYIAGCMQSLRQQDYPLDDVEWLFVDGGSSDRTVAIIEDLLQEYTMHGRVLDNPGRTAPHAMNVGIQAAQGEIIIRLDAHAEYSPNYIRRCVYYLEHEPVANVGGFWGTVGRGFVGECVAAIQTSRFGAGNSRFRLSQQTEYVDTVPFGAFHRELFQQIGLFKTDLPRSEDNEINYRIRKAGGKILMAGDIYTKYYCRDTVKGFLSMAFANGKGVGTTLRKYPGVLSFIYTIPMWFTLMLLAIVLGMLFGAPDQLLLCGGGVLALYFLLDLWYSFHNSLTLTQRILLLFLYPAYHVSYGVGTLWGLVPKKE